MFAVWQETENGTEILDMFENIELAKIIAFMNCDKGDCHVVGIVQDEIHIFNSYRAIVEV